MLRDGKKCCQFEFKFLNSTKVRTSWPFLSPLFGVSCQLRGYAAMAAGELYLNYGIAMIENK